MAGYMPNEGLHAIGAHFFGDTYIGLLAHPYEPIHESTRFDFFDSRARFSGYNSLAETEDMELVSFETTNGNGFIHGLSSSCRFEHDGGPLEDIVGGFYSRINIIPHLTVYPGAPYFGGLLNNPKTMDDATDVIEFIVDLTLSCGGEDVPT